MSEYANLENAVVAVLGELDHGGGALFVDAAGVTADRALALAALERMRTPAACVAIEGRPARSQDAPTPAEVRLVVYLAAENLRGPQGTRQDDVDGVGAFTLAEQAAGALGDAVVATDWRLRLLDERVEQADERRLVVVQRYRAMRLPTLALPTWNGAVIVGAAAQVDVEIGPLRTIGYDLALAGAGYDLRQNQDVGELRIYWRGWLRAANHAALTDLENALAARVGDGQSGTVADAFGRSFSDCTVVGFERPGARRLGSPSGWPMQAFELTFSRFVLA